MHKSYVVGLIVLQTVPQKLSGFAVYRVLIGGFPNGLFCRSPNSGDVLKLYVSIGTFESIVMCIWFGRLTYETMLQHVHVVFIGLYINLIEHLHLPHPFKEFSNSSNRTPSGISPTQTFLFAC